MFTTQSLFSTVFGSNVDWRRVATGSHSFVQVHVGASGEVSGRMSLFMIPSTLFRMYMTCCIVQVWAIDTDGKPFRMVSYEDDYDEENELSIVSMMSCSEPSSRDIVKNRPTSTNTGNTIDLFPQFEEPNGLSMDSPLGIVSRETMNSSSPVPFLSLSFLDIQSSYPWYNVLQYPICSRSVESSPGSWMGGIFLWRKRRIEQSPKYVFFYGFISPSPCGYWVFSDWIDVLQEGKGKLVLL